MTVCISLGQIASNSLLIMTTIAYLVNQYPKVSHSFIRPDDCLDVS
ncbi:hypothetical protein AM1_2782 [Acaryochloris marina MBIC11017]|uniref:Uncharacterized protein n=1 Tax=Acaryochloris marina (strain MBIC 11017) TaxID=329726 RepID=B0C9A1_ACAM1|nr:hypothetical protein AM1_2782 [Acaryochloris marina MBIC11017]